MTMYLPRRREVIMAGAATLPALAAASATSGGPVAKPPTAKSVGVVDHVFGFTLPDPYRWMENPADPDWISYMRAQNGYARSVLDKIPDRAVIARRISKLSSQVDAIGAVQRRGELTFLSLRPRGAETFKVYVEASGAARRLLVDPDGLATSTESHVSLDYWSASPNGRYMLVGTSSAGSEASVARIIDVRSGAMLPQIIDRVPLGQPAWLPDSSGYFYNRQQAGVRRGSPGYLLDTAVWLHRVGVDPSLDVRIAARQMDPAPPMQPTDLPFVFTAPGSDHCVLLVRSGASITNPLWTADLVSVVAGRPQWRQVATADDGIVTALGDDPIVALRGRTLYLLSRKDAPLGRVLSVDAAAPDLSRSREVVAQGSETIQTIAAAKDGLYVQIIDGGPERLRRADYNQASVVDILTPGNSGVRAIFAASDQDGVDVLLSGWVQLPAVWRCDAASSGLTKTKLAPQAMIDTSPYTVTRLDALASDGANIPMFIVAHRRTPQDAKRPCLLQAYGAYGLTLKPTFDPAMKPFLDAGGVIVTAGVRGGGEYGRSWQEGGKGAKKCNTWQDAIAAAQALVAARWTSADALTLWGRSAGGIMVGRAITDRPDLFAAAVDEVGWVNLTRFAHEPNGPVNYAEVGDPAIEANYRNLYAMDAYQHVRDGVAYPAVLVVAGMMDPRVAPWNGGKFAARLQSATSSGRPVLLRVDFEAGHGHGSTRDQRDDLVADITSFALWRGGVPASQPS